MKRRIVYNLFLLFVLHSSLLANQSQQGFEQIECTLIPIAHRIQKTKHDSHAQISTVEHVSHPRIPGPTSSDTRLPENSAFSTNWAGYVAADNLNNPTQNSVTAVSGSWIIPSIVPVCNDTYSAYWVGIDGWASPTVEQIGTAHDFVNGAVEYYAWFEMFPNGAFIINGFPVNPGDVINASVIYAGSNVFTLSITNVTQNVSFTVPSSFTTMAGTLRSSAEWIVEAPFLNVILPLMDFVTATVRNGVTTINGITGPIQDANWQDTDIIMVTNTSVPKATPTALLQDNESFFVVWEHQ